jgi:hypothetical protein
MDGALVFDVSHSSHLTLINRLVTLQPWPAKKRKWPSLRKKLAALDAFANEIFCRQLFDRDLWRAFFGGEFQREFIANRSCSTLIVDQNLGFSVCCPRTHR